MKLDKYCDTVGLTIRQNFTPRISTRYGATRVYKGRDGHSIKAIVLHTTGNPSAHARNEADNIKNNEGVNSFHVVVDQSGVIETVKFADTAHHAGDKYTNLTTLGFELSDYMNDAAAGYDNYIKYIAYVFYQLGLTPNHNTVLFHNEIVSTSCGAYLRNKGKDQIIKDIKHYLGVIKGDSAAKPSPAPKPKPQEKPKPAPVKPSADRRFINIHTGYQDKYGIYTLDQVPQAKNLKHYLLPNKLGGLSYEIIGNSSYHNVYIISTRDFGRVQIYLDEPRATITSKPVYKVYGESSKAQGKPVSQKLKVGDTVEVINNIQYNGGTFYAGNKNYKLIELVGDRAVIATHQGVVIAAVNVKNLRKA